MQQDSKGYEFLGRPVCFSYLSFVIGNSLTASLWAWAAFFRSTGGNSALWPAAAFAALVFGFSGVWWISARSLEASLQIPRPEARRRSALYFNAWLIPAFFLPEYLLGNTPPLFRSYALIALSGLLFLGFSWIGMRRSPQEGNPSAARKSRIKLVFLVFLVTYFGVCTYLAVRKFHVFGYVGQDLAYFGQCFHTTLHGHFFHSNLLQDLLYARPVSSDFATHNSLIMMVFLPFYSVHESPITLLIVRNLFMVLCAWPAYLLARQRFSAALSVGLAVCFLLLPPILYQSVFDFYPLSLSAFFLLFAFYFYSQHRFLLFSLFGLLTLFVREDLVFAVFCFGLLALWQRYGKKWALAPMGLAAFWAVLSWRIVFPHFLNGAPYPLTNFCFGHLGSSRTDMVHNLLSHPARILLLRSNLVYLKQLITPFAGVLFLGSAAPVFALPYLGINLLAGGGPCITTVLFTQYSVIPTTVFFVGFVETLHRIQGIPTRWGIDASRAPAAVVLFVVVLTFASLVFLTGRTQVDEFRAQPWNDEARRVVHLIPPDVPVAAPRYMLPMLANRFGLYQTHRLLDYHNPNPEYIIIDRDWSHIIAAETWKEEYRQLECGLEKDPDFQRIYESKNYVIYRASVTSGVLQRLGVAPRRYD